MKQIFSRLLLITLGFIIPLFMVEFGVRLTNLAPPPEPNPTIWQPHPLLGWWHIPYSGGLFHNDFNEFETDVHINARGLRDREIGYDNPSHAFRVLSLADSFGESLQVPLEQTYHKQLESHLSASLGHPVEVINGGVGGWGTDQEAIFYLSEGFRYNPDIVLLAFFIRNDTVNNYGPLEIARNGGSQQKQFFSLSPTGELIAPPLDISTTATVTPTTSPTESPLLLPLADTLWQYSAIYRFATPYLRNIPPLVQNLGPSGILGGEGVVRAHHPTTPLEFFIYQEPPNEPFTAAWQLTESLIAHLQIEVTKRNSKLVVVLIGAPEQVYPAEWETLLTRNPAFQGITWNLDSPNQRLNQFLTAQNIPHLDLLPIFRQAAAQPNTPPLHLRHDQHWTVTGHALAAQAIGEYLEKELGIRN